MMAKFSKNISAVVAESNSAPAFHVQATGRPLNIELAIGAPLPALTHRKIPQHYILLFSLVLVQLLKLLAANPIMPWDLTLRAKHPVAAGTLRLPHGLSAVIEQHHRAILERAVESLRTRKQCLAQCQSPAVENLGRNYRLTMVGLQRPCAARDRAGYGGDIVLELGSHVLGRTVRTVGVATAFDRKRLICGLGFDADFADERRVGLGIRRLAGFEEWRFVKELNFVVGGFVSQVDEIKVVVFVRTVN